MVFYLSYSIIVGDFIILKKDRERDEDEEKMVGGLIGKLIAVLLIMNMLVFLQVYAAVKPVKRSGTVQSTAVEQKELRGVWFSYIDWSEMPSDVESFKKRADQVMTDIKKSRNECYYFVMYTVTRTVTVRN